MIIPTTESTLRMTLMQLSETKLELTAVTEQRDQYKAALQSADNHNHEIATKLEIVTEQRDEARRLAEKYRNLSCQDQDQADATLLPWETNQSIKP